MCVCACLCVWVCVHACVHIMCVHVHAHKHVCVCVCMCVCVHIGIYAVFVCLWLYTCVCMCLVKWANMLKGVCECAYVRVFVWVGIKLWFVIMLNLEFLEIELRQSLQIYVTFWSLHLTTTCVISSPGSDSSQWKSKQISPSPLPLRVWSTSTCHAIPHILFLLYKPLFFNQC